MYPILLKLGPVTIHTFGVMLAIAIIVGSTFLLRETRRLGDPRIDEARMQRLIWYIVLAVIAGGRFMHVLVNFDDYRHRPLDSFKIWEGGLVMYGGLLAIFFTVIGFAVKNRIRILRLCDLCAPSCFLGDAIGRWGCFFAGDDYGRPTDSWLGITFTHPETLVPPALRGIPLHPTQIYMSLKALIIFGVLLAITRHKKFDGQVAGWSFILYAVLRSIVEFFRGDLDRGFIGPLSTAQATSIGVFATGLLILLVAPRRTLADDLAADAARPAAASPRRGKKRRR
jgi:phosphatidylglycerol---prolipoprotein diacylglyceryl transferase